MTAAPNGQTARMSDTERSASLEGRISSAADHGMELAEQVVYIGAGLLLVFILVELLGAVRATLAERRLVAEPFLIVGIIASIKAIVVSSLDASKSGGEAFEELMIEVSVLGVVILLLALASWLVRRKEREPTEG